MLLQRFGIFVLPGKREGKTGASHSFLTAILFFKGLVFEIGLQV